MFIWKLCWHWRSGSVLKSTDCYSTGSEFYSLQSHCSSQPSIVGSDPLLWHKGMHADRVLIDIKEIIKAFKRLHLIECLSCNFWDIHVILWFIISICCTNFYKWNNTFTQDKSMLHAHFYCGWILFAGLVWEFCCWCLVLLLWDILNMWPCLVVNVCGSQSPQNFIHPPTPASWPLGLLYVTWDFVTHVDKGY